MTMQCRTRLLEQLRASVEQELEDIVYFVGLTTGITTLAVSGVRPEATRTPASVDVDASEIGKIVRSASVAGLQVVGQLHTHPADAYHSEGDLLGMRIRYPGYFSIVVPEYGILLPSFEASNTVVWTAGRFQEIHEPIRLLGDLG